MNCLVVFPTFFNLSLNLATNHQGNANQTPMRYHLTPIRMVIIKTAEDNSIAKDVEKWKPL